MWIPQLDDDDDIPACKADVFIVMIMIMMRMMTVMTMTFHLAK